MDFTELLQSFLKDIRSSGIMEWIGVIAGIVSVWFSKKENVWVYPIGLINTLFFVYISAEAHLFGEATVNIYYTVMSIYGWILWTRKDKQHQKILHISTANQKEWLQHLLFFAVFYIVIFSALHYLKNSFYDSVIPWADALASATAFTGMWLMAKKKVESWYWWIATNITSIPLYYVKGLVLTSVYYVILLALAFWGLSEWKKKARARSH